MVCTMALRALGAAAIGYLCEHNATLAAADGGCQAEIGVAIERRHRVSVDATVAAMAQTAKGHEQQVQGDQRSGTGRVGHAVLITSTWNASTRSMSA